MLILLRACILSRSIASSCTRGSVCYLSPKISNLGLQGLICGGKVLHLLLVVCIFLYELRILDLLLDDLLDHLFNDLRGSLCWSGGGSLGRCCCLFPFLDDGLLDGMCLLRRHLWCGLDNFGSCCWSLRLESRDLLVAPPCT